MRRPLQNIYCGSMYNDLLPGRRNSCRKSDLDRRRRKIIPDLYTNKIRVQATECSKTKNPSIKLVRWRSQRPLPPVQPLSRVSRLACRRLGILLSISLASRPLLATVSSSSSHDVSMNFFNSPPSLDLPKIIYHSLHVSN